MEITCVRRLQFLGFLFAKVVAEKANGSEVGIRQSSDFIQTEPPVQREAQVPQRCMLHVSRNLNQMERSETLLQFSIFQRNATPIV